MPTKKKIKTQQKKNLTTTNKSNSQKQPTQLKLTWPNKPDKQCKQNHKMGGMAAKLHRPLEKTNHPNPTQLEIQQINIKQQQKEPTKHPNDNKLCMTPWWARCETKIYYWLKHEIQRSPGIKTRKSYRIKTFFSQWTPSLHDKIGGTGGL